jgi:hypothetical protein
MSSRRALHVASRDKREDTGRSAHVAKRSIRPPSAALTRFHRAGPRSHAARCLAKAQGLSARGSERSGAHQAILLTHASDGGRSRNISEMHVSPQQKQKACGNGAIAYAR